MVEEDVQNLSTEKLLIFIQDTKLSDSKSIIPLTDNEKIILLAMLSIRVFSENTTMDLNDTNRSDNWLNIFLEITQMAEEEGLINCEKRKFISQGNEHPISYLMRRANDLPKKTNQLYKLLRKKEYYLDIPSINSKSMKDLISLYKKVYPKEISIEKLSAINSRMMDILYNKGILVRNLDHINSDWDHFIKQSLRNYIYGIK
jgi:hypothetical protein